MGDVIGKEIIPSQACVEYPLSSFLRNMAFLGLLPIEWEINMPRLIVITLALLLIGIPFGQRANGQGIDDSTLSPITVQNAAELTEIARWGRGSVNDIAWSPDGKILAIASASSGVSLFDTHLNETAKIVGGNINQVLFSPNGSILATEGNGGGVRLWDIVSSEIIEIASLPGRLVGFRSDGEAVAYRLDDGTLRALDIVDHLEHEFSPNISGAMLNADWTMIATVNSDSPLVTIWDASTRIAKHSVDGNRFLAFGDDETYFATALGGEVYIWETETGSHISTFSTRYGNETFHLGFIPDNNYAIAYTNDLNYNKELFNIQTGKPILFGNQSISSYSIAFSPTGNQLFWSDWPNQMTAWVIETNTFVTKPSVPSRILQMEISPDGKFLATAGSNGFQLWNAQNLDLLASLNDTNSWVANVEFSTDGSLLLSSSLDNLSRVWDVQSGQQITMDIGIIQQVTLTPQKIFILKQADLCKSLPEGEKYYFPHLSSYYGGSNTVSTLDEQIWATPGYEGATISFCLTGKTWSLRHSGLRELVFNAQGTYLATSGDGQLKLWETATGKELWVLSDTGAIGVTFSPDGILIAFNDIREQKIFLLNAALGEITPLPGYNRYDSTLIFSPDGKLLYDMGGYTLRVWEVETGQEVAVLNTDWMHSIAVHPQGDLIALAADDGTVRVWGVPKR